MFTFVLLLLAADGGQPEANELQLRAYRSLEAVPRAWRPFVPADLNFTREMLVTRAPADATRIEVQLPARVSNEKRAMRVWAVQPPHPPPTCAPCRGASIGPEPAALVPEPSLPALVLRVPRVPGVVLEVVELQRAPPVTPECPVCRVP